MPNQFFVGGVRFEAVRYSTPIKHWRLRLPNGEVLEPGTAGISTDSRPHMVADLEYLLSRFGQERFVKELAA